ncbi:MAG TPA: hypothetical protein DCQ30_11035 [Acidimicrobiaceae bacterium]|nr:hypothetical protein [Acidimicrobiaceae bacterium]
MPSPAHPNTQLRVVRAAVVAGAAAIVVAVVLLEVLPGSPAARSRGGGSPTSTTPSPPTSTSTTAPSPTPDGTYAVGSVTTDITEPVASGPSRSLPTAVWFPATTAGGTTPNGVHAPYPLVLFSPGYDVDLTPYTTLIEDVASAGFVVAAPLYPHTAPNDPTGVNENDIVNHPADLRFVITTLLGDAQQPGTTLSGLLNGSAIGLAGHSDGGDVALAVGADSCCFDRRVKALAVLSGAELAAFGGSYFTGPVLPMLVVQGSADTINPPPCSTQIYDGAPAPKYYLDLLGAGHLPPYADSGPDRTAVARVVTDFFDATLAGQQAGTPAMGTDGNVAGVAAFTTAPSAPAAPGSCPGAPG